jgi:hypothetical protein
LLLWYRPKPSGAAGARGRAVGELDFADFADGVAAAAADRGTVAEAPVAGTRAAAAAASRPTRAKAGLDLIVTTANPQAKSGLASRTTTLTPALAF